MISIALQEVYKKNHINFYIIICLFSIGCVLFYYNYINKVIVSNLNVYTVGDNSFLKTVKYVENNDKLKNKEKIIDIDMYYSYYLIADPISPYEFQEKAIKEKNGRIIGYIDQYRTMEDIENIDDEKVYILIKNDNVHKLLENNFKIEKIIGNYVILVK